MLWIWLPIALIVVVIAVWIMIGSFRRHGGSGVHEQGRVVYDRDNPRNAPNPPG
jgi:hypothetical protein